MRVGPVGQSGHSTTVALSWFRPRAPPPRGGQRPPAARRPAPAAPPPADDGFVDADEDWADDDNDRERLIGALEQCGRVQAKAARLLKVTPRQLGCALQKHRIEVRKLCGGAVGPPSSV
jgi:Nif-specific regulatory protein